MTVCSTCNDTHAMALGAGQVMCTRCPVPCELCRARHRNGGAGAYCATTPCTCACHASRGTAPTIEIDRPRADAELRIARLETDLARVTKQRDTVESALRVAVDQHKALRADLAAMTGDRDTVLEHVEMVASVRDGALAARDRLREQLGAARAELHLLRGERDQLAVRVVEVEAERDRLADKIARLRRSLDDSLRAEAEARDRVNELAAASKETT